MVVGLLGLLGPKCSGFQSIFKALFVAVASILLGYLPASFLLPGWLVLLLGLVVTFLAPLAVAEKAAGTSHWQACKLASGIHLGACFQVTENVLDSFFLDAAF